jgi:hypothetical protein
MKKIEQKLDAILEKLSQFEERLSRVEASCQGMATHIGFIERVYGTLRSPLDYILAQVNRLSGGTPQALPAIEGRRVDVLLEY